MPEPKTAVQELEAAKLSIAEKDTELADLRKQLETAKADCGTAQAALTAEQGKTADLTKQVSELTSKVAKGDADFADALKLVDQEKARADKAEKKLALDPDHIDVSGRALPLKETAQAGTAQSDEDFQKAYEAETDPAKRTAMWRERFEKKS